MPLDILCPSCRSPFPVTNDGPEFHVECPECDAGIGISVQTPDAGKIGSVPKASARLAAAPAAKHVAAAHALDDEDGDAPKRRSGRSSMWVVLLGSSLGLVLVLAGVGTTGYFLFTNLDTDDPASRTASSPAQNRTTGTGGGGTNTIYIPNPNSGSNFGPNFNPGIPRPGPTFTPPPMPSIPRPAPAPSRPSGIPISRPPAGRPK